MSQITVAYWSGTGNTQAMAELVAKGIIDAGKEAKVVSVEEIAADSLKDEGVFALGCPSMGAEQLEESVMEDFVTEVEGFASGKKLVFLAPMDGETDSGCVTGWKEWKAQELLSTAVKMLFVRMHRKVMEKMLV